MVEQNGPLLMVQYMVRQSNSPCYPGFDVFLTERVLTPEMRRKEEYTFWFLS